MSFLLTRFGKPARNLPIIAILSSSCFTIEAFAADTNLPSLKYEWPTNITGTIHDKVTTNLLFDFKRTSTRSGTNLNVLREYTYPDGKVAARETVVYEGDTLLSYTLDEVQTGEAGSARITYDRSNKKTGRIRFSFQPAGDTAAEKSERLPANALTADMIAPFIKDHWTELMKGRKVECRYLVVTRKETVGFTFVKDREMPVQGKPVVIIRMEPSSWVIGLVAKPLFFTIEKEGQRRVLQYTGRTTPKLKIDGEWKDLDAITIFNWN